MTWKSTGAAAAIALLSNFATSADADEILLWGPSDFDGVFINIRDRAENGCWTNIGETDEYASDQLALTGFKVVEKPVPVDGKSSTIIDDNYAMLTIEVVASRWNDGTCVGHVMTYFYGSQIPRKRLRVLVADTIGPPKAWTIWDNKNLNNLVLDHIKGFIPYWVGRGTTERRED